MATQRTLSGVGRPRLSVSVAVYSETTSLTYSIVNFCVPAKFFWCILGVGWDWDCVL
jgi:hypothetical protein